MTDAMSAGARSTTGTTVPPAARGAGFSATVVVPAAPDTVFSHFTQPDLFARWFVVDGFTTPADEIRLEPRPGGLIDAVLVSVDGATRIPFQARYGRLDPPHLAQFTSSDPDETVTIDVRPVAGGRTRVGYHNPTGDPDDVRGARFMLDALASSLTGMPRESAADSSAADGEAAPDLTGLVKRIDLPVGFAAPPELRHGDLTARAIGRADLEDDVAGINASLDLIRRTRGGLWPAHPVTAAGNYIDLVWHECEFRDGKSFTYAVRSDRDGYLGCCYLYPVGVRQPLTEELLRHDVDVSWWVTPDAYRAGHYQALYQALRHWVSTDFPFTSALYSNVEVPGPDRPGPPT